MDTRTVVIGGLLLAALPAATLIAWPPTAVAGKPQVLKAELTGEQIQALATAIPDFTSLLKKRPRELPFYELQAYSVEIVQKDRAITIEFAPETREATGGGTVYFLERPFQKVSRRLFTK
jgi:hypothetical protein